VCTFDGLILKEKCPRNISEGLFLSFGKNPTKGSGERKVELTGSKVWAIIICLILIVLLLLNQPSFASVL